MIIVCPECDSQYLVNAKAIGEGRTVKCASCGHSWYQEPVEDEVDQALSSASEAERTDTEKPTDKISEKEEAPKEDAPDIEEVSETTEEAPEEDSEFDDIAQDDESENKGEPAGEDEAVAAKETKDDDDAEDVSEEAGEESPADDTPPDDVNEDDDTAKESESQDGDDEYIGEDDDLDDDDLDDVLQRLQGAADNKDKKERDMDPIPKGLGPIDDDEPAVAGEKKKRSGASGLGVVVVALALLAGTILAGITNKEAIAHIWPPSAGLFDMLGMPIDVIGAGLEFSDINATIKETDTVTYLVIGGRIDNVRDEAITVPAMKVQLHKNGKIVQDWVIPSEEFVIGADESVPFEYGLPTPLEREADSVTVSFATADDIVAATSQ